MTEDITSLQIKIAYDQIDATNQRLQKLEQTGGKAKKSLEGISSSSISTIKHLLEAAAASEVVAKTIEAVRAVVEKTVEFERMKARLVGVTGSVEDANKAFEVLEEYARSTPFKLTSLTEAFMRLANMGLTPSERALKAYGDLAAATGKDITDVVENMSMATEGMFRGLRQYGVTSRIEGDKIKFRFRGVSTTVKNSAAEIEKYLIRLSELHFAGAMDRQMQTLSGTLIKTHAEWDSFLATIGENGMGDVVNSGLQWVVNTLAELTEKMKSGEMQHEIDSWIVGWKDLATEGVKSIRAVADEVDTATKEMGDDTDGFFTKFKNGLKELPQNLGLVFRTGYAKWEQLNANYQLGKETIGAGVDYAKTSTWNAMRYGWARATGPWYIGTPDNEADAYDQNKIDAQNESRTHNITVEQAINQKNYASRLEAIWKVGSEVSDETQAKLDEALSKYDNVEVLKKKAEADAAKAKEEFGVTEWTLKNGDDAASDRLSPYGGKVDAEGLGVKPKNNSAKWESLKASLEREEGLITESYERRLALIKEFTDEGSAYQTTMEIALTKKVEDEQTSRINKLKEQPETMMKGFEEEEKLIKDSYERRKKIILDSTELTETEKAKLLEDAELRYTASMRKHEQDRNKVIFGTMAEFFGNISTIAGAFGKKGAKIAKAAAIAETTVKTYQGATSAYAALSGIPYVGPALGLVAAAAAVAAGLANVQKIRATDETGGYSGAYAIGGLIPPGSVGLVGEAGPELVKGPAMVTSAAATWDRMGGAANNFGNQVHVSIVNNTGAEVTQNTKQNGDKQMIEFIIGQVKDGVAADIAKGGTKISKGIEHTYNLSRGRRA